jgi:hypothetical protein
MKWVRKLFNDQITEKLFGCTCSLEIDSSLKNFIELRHVAEVDIDENIFPGFPYYHFYVGLQVHKKLQGNKLWVRL